MSARLKQRLLLWAVVAAVAVETIVTLVLDVH